MRTILRHNHPVADALRAQLEVCRIKHRKFTGVGFFTDIVVPQALTVPGIGNLQLGDAVAEIAGSSVGRASSCSCGTGCWTFWRASRSTNHGPTGSNYSVDSADTLTPNDLHALDAAERRVR